MRCIHLKATDSLKSSSREEKESPSKYYRNRERHPRRREPVLNLNSRPAKQFQIQASDCHEVTQGIRQKPPTRSNRYNVKGKCEMWRGWGDPVTLVPMGFLHRLAHTSLFRRTWPTAVLHELQPGLSHG